MTLPGVSIIVIGRNEAKHIPGCIASIRSMNYPKRRLEVIYVDTGSTDGSPQIARSLGVKVYEECGGLPSPAGARNRGLSVAAHDIVHFVDGDMMVEPDYLRKAVRLLGENSTACVFGRVMIQQHNGISGIIERLLHYPWTIKSPGYADSPGAGGTFVKSALAEVGGYNSDLLRSEETDLGFRLRQRGYRILLIEQTMGFHSYDTRTFGALWTRYQSIGYSLGRVMQLPAAASIAIEKQAAGRALLQGILTIIIATALMSFGLWWVVALFPVALICYVILRYWKPRKYRGLRIAYFMMEYCFKPAIWTGMLEFVLRGQKRGMTSK